MKPLFLILTALLLSCGVSQAGEAEIVGGYNLERLVNAIYKAEGGSKTRHLYGILARYKHTTPRQACINTLRHKARDWEAQGSKGDYLDFLAKRYCPVGASNDPLGLNAHWLGNVARLYETASKTRILE